MGIIQTISANSSHSLMGETFMVEEKKKPEKILPSGFLHPSPSLHTMSCERSHVNESHLLPESQEI